MKKKINPEIWAKQQKLRVIETLIADHYAQLCYMAKNYVSSNVSREDLIAQGTLGLITAFNKFDESRNIKFSTYAYYWIKNKMLNFVNKQNEFLLQEQNNNILFDCFSFSNGHIYLKESGNDSGVIVNGMMLELQIYFFEIFINMIPKIQGEIMRLRHKKKTLEQVGEILGMSRERIRQLEKQTIKEFQDYIKNVLKIDNLEACINLIIICRLLLKSMENIIQ